MNYYERSLNRRRKIIKLAKHCSKLKTHQFRQKRKKVSFLA